MSEEAGSEVHPGARREIRIRTTFLRMVNPTLSAIQNKLAAHGTSRPSLAEHDYEVVHDPQTRRHPFSLVCAIGQAPRESPETAS
jgi:hypothetical protein